MRSYKHGVWSSRFFFFQAEDGIRDIGVTGVQTCALPIYQRGREHADHGERRIAATHLHRMRKHRTEAPRAGHGLKWRAGLRSEERRVGKECRTRSGRDP